MHLAYVYDSLRLPEVKVDLIESWLQLVLKNEFISFFSIFYAMRCLTLLPWYVWYGILEFNVPLDTV